jgi:hypothetical protein
MNVYNKFRGIEKVANKYTLSKRFDEPTYFSFHLIFGSNLDGAYNYADNKASYDTMPHPLFNPAGTLIVPVPSSTISSSTQPLMQLTTYSSVKYLEDANEPTRAEMMKEFITKFNDLQTNYPYYFQQIDGVSELLKIDTTKGQRITNDKKITITCLEGLDLRMSYLMNLYRKIAWDDVYQRWVLPDMMRYFTLNIYLAEFRTFHIPTTSQSDKVYGYGDDALRNQIQVTSSTPDTTTLAGQAGEIQKNSQLEGRAPSDTPIYLKILDDVLPTWQITCEMCEFDITDVTYDHLGGLNVATDPIQGSVKFGIKIGNIKEIQTYPVFQHMFLIDRKLNGINRADSAISTQDPNDKFLYPSTLQVAQTRDYTDSAHISGGLPYNQQTNENTTDNTKGVYPIKPAESLSVATETDTHKQNEPTWIGNAIKFGTAFASKFVNTVIDKAKVTPIPGLGVSFSEVADALQSKNIITALGLIRKGVNEVANQYDNAPSSQLQKTLVTDTIMRNFVTELANMPKSEATDKPTVELIAAANLVLSDKGLWEKIKDYSLATDLVGPGETNTPKSLEGTTQYSQITAKEGVSRLSSPLDAEIGVIPIVLPNAASGNIADKSIDEGLASSKLSGNLTSKLPNEIPSDLLNGNIKSNIMNSEPASDRLSGDAGAKLDEGKSSSLLSSKVQKTAISQEPASDKLSGNISKNLITAKPSQLLGSSIENKPINEGTASSKLLSSITTDGITQGKPSEKLSAITSGSIIPTPMPSGNLSSKIKGYTQINQPAPNIKTTEIKLTQVIESTPTSTLYKKIEGEKIKQPAPGQAAANAKDDNNK